MKSAKFWSVAIVVTGALHELLVNGLIPAEWVPYVAPAVTFLGFLVQKHRAEAAK